VTLEEEFEEFDAANCVYEQWLASRHSVGPWQAWLNTGFNLRAARRTLERIASGVKADCGVRAMAFVNAGNILDGVGRPFEAINLFDKALRLLPDFGMARGNRGMAYARLIPHLHQDHALLAVRAREDLTFAISVADTLHPGAKEAFDGALQHLPRPKQGEPIPETTGPYQDLYAEWSFRHRLLLTAIPDHRPLEAELDHVHLRNITVSLDRDDAHSPAEFVALNAMKRDYLSARFLAWLALEAPATADLATRSRSAYYTETLDYARWDLPSGLAATALAAAVNLTDKIGVFLALWLQLGVKAKNVDHRNWAFIHQKSGDPLVRPAIDELMRAKCGSLSAVLGLVDLSREEWDPEPSAAALRRAIRNAAVHRFLSVHEIGTGRSTEFVEGVSDDQLRQETVAALNDACRLILQLIVAVSQRERSRASTRAKLRLSRYERG
jgi:tetratricopeptide (TPR) repeat protein